MTAVDLDGAVTLISSSSRRAVDLQLVGLEAVRVGPENLEHVLAQPGCVVVDALRAGSWSSGLRSLLEHRVADVVLLLDEGIAVSAGPDGEGPGLRVVRAPVHARDVAAAVASLRSAAVRREQGDDVEPRATPEDPHVDDDPVVDLVAMEHELAEQRSGTPAHPQASGATADPEPQDEPAPRSWFSRTRRPAGGPRVVSGAFLADDTAPAAGGGDGDGPTDEPTNEQDDWAAAALATSPHGPAGTAPGAAVPDVDDAVASAIDDVRPGAAPAEPLDPPPTGQAREADQHRQTPRVELVKPTPEPELLPQDGAATELETVLEQVTGHHAPSAPWRPDWEQVASALLDHLEGAETWTEVAQRIVQDCAAWTETDTVILVREPDGTWVPAAGVGLRQLEFGLKLLDTHPAVQYVMHHAPVVLVADTDELRGTIANMPLASRRSVLIGRVPDLEALVVAGTSARSLVDEDVHRVGVVLTHLALPLRLSLERRAVAAEMQRFL